jgi:hypothetical protein
MASDWLSISRKRKIMAKLYTVILDVPYEGYGAPEAVFFKKRHAQKFADFLNKREKRHSDFTYYDVVPIDHFANFEHAKLEVLKQDAVLSKQDAKRDREIARIQKAARERAKQ